MLVTGVWVSYPSLEVLIAGQLIGREGLDIFQHGKNERAG
jgi:hypothetical protein